MIVYSNRTFTFGRFYFLYFILVLHICTAFLTVISALNDREEILQFSADSFQFVNSDDSSDINIESTINDNEEKELLSVLIQSYDNSRVKSIDIKLSNTNSFPFVRFVPPTLHFSDQSIAIPRLQTFQIINDDSTSLQIYSLKSETNQFYSSILQPVTIPPNGGNISINIYYLPRTLGRVRTTFMIKTNRANFSYQITGVGIENAYRLRPLIGIEIPPNATYEYIIQFYNPFNHSLNINEIYTSDENLILELLTINNPKNRLSKTFQYHEQWYLQAYETKSIVKINYSAFKFDQLIGFICIKTNLFEKIILPIEIHISNRSSLYSNVDLLELSIERFLRSMNRSIRIPVYAFNYGAKSEIITDIRIPLEYEAFLSIEYKNLPIPPDIHRLNQIADLTIDLNALPESLEQLHGSIEVFTSSNTTTLSIPFNEKVYYGSLDWDSDETNVFLSNRTDTKHCRLIKIYNRFRTIISVHNITIENMELVSNFIQIQIPSTLFNLYPNRWNKLFCISFLRKSLDTRTFRTQIEIHTNLSKFYIPIHLYNGFIEFDIFDDHTNGGIQRSAINPNEFILTSTPVNTLRTVGFVLINSNPIDIEIERIQSLLDIQLNSIEDFDGNEIDFHSNEDDVYPIIIPQQHRAIFSLTINGTDLIQSYDQLINIQTKYQSLDIHVKYEIISNSLELANHSNLQLDVYPDQIASAEIYLINKFPMSIQLTRIHFIAYGVCFSFKSSNTSIEKLVLRSNQIEKIGELTFDTTPLCKVSEPNFYCHLNSHPEFKSQWQDLVHLLDKYQLNQDLVEQFRSLSKNWIKFLRKQTIQTNIWLYSTHANISLPVTVNFRWPSVIQQTSSPPITLDFNITCINTTKTQNITITNPTSNVLSYSIEFLNDENSSFSIASPTNQILSQFNLQPNEQMILSIIYHPKFAVQEQTYLIIRNNFTIIESIDLIGEGGLGNLQIGSEEFPIVLEINSNQYEFCLNSAGNSILEKILILRNTGNMLTIIHDISFSQSKCQGQGFSVANCRNIRIEPNEKHSLIILYQPDYTTNEINETMILSTNIGRIIVPISVRISQRILSLCYKTIPRPPWEIRPYCIGLCTIILSIILIFTLAVFDARKIFDNYLTRAEWRENIQGLNNKIFDLKDLSSAIQDEQKPREQVDVNQNHETKKEPKPKRSFNSNKTSQKTRRSTDSGSTKKQISETTSKIEPVVVIREPIKTPVPIRQISSSTVTDEDENEPFIVPRTKRLSNRRKGSFINSSGENKSIEESKPTEVNNDQQWQVVSSNRGQRKANISSQTKVQPKPNTQTEKSPESNQRSRKGIAENVNRELVFRQLTEQLWQGHLLNSPPTAPSTSIRSRCSSAPPSERGGDADETIDWDEPDTPDEDFGRYASQTENSMNDSNEIDDDKSMIPPLMSLNVPQHQPLTATKSLTIPKENIEPLPFPQHKPGPIQRPINLQFASVLQTASTMFQDSPQSPMTPDVLVQINHLVDHQNSLAQNSSTLINDLPTPSSTWTPFTPNEWPSTWSTGNNQNPFAQRQLSKDDSTLWSSTPIKDSWLKFSPAPEPFNRQENETNWWPKSSSNENKNNNTNNNNNNNDHSRWDFAR